MKKLVMIAASLMAAATAAPATAQVQWISGPGANNHYYQYIGQIKSFSDALAAATFAPPISGYTAHLATITSQEEQDFIFALVGRNQFIWIAGSDADNEGTWKWVAGPEAGQTFWKDGTTLTYANWGVAEPNNSGSGEHFLILNNLGTGTWNDSPSQFGNALGYVVEWSPSALGVVPEPATWAMLILGFGLTGGAMRARKRRTFALVCTPA